MKSALKTLFKFETKLYRGKHLTPVSTVQRLYSSERNVYMVDEDDSNGTCSSVDNANKYTQRTHHCGELRSTHIGQKVTLCGWLEYKRMNKFLVLRDSYGEIQVLVKDADVSKQKIIENTPFESIIVVKGTVLSRPSDMVNSKQTTGEIEVQADDLQILNKAKDVLPFNIREFQKAKEPLRMQYRYLDLRFPQMQHNLRVRSELLMKMREYLVSRCSFVDVETPTLFKATPGGAQEFVVPTRFPGQFYSLVQSPQQFKQMLMAGGIDRYFQIARCYRDEGARPDRQPEFTQLDIEMSFTSITSIMELIEDLLRFSWPQFLNPLPNKFDRITYQEAMQLYGSDQPDIRFGFQLQNCTDILQENKSLVTTEDFGAYCIVFPQPYGNLNNKTKENLADLLKGFPKAKLVQSKISSPKEWCKKIERLLPEELVERFLRSINVPKDSVLFLGYGKKDQVLSLMGKVRLEYVNSLEQTGLKVRQPGMHFLWVVDFPLFEIDGETNSLKPVHHPFTSPKPEDLHLLEDSPLKVRSLAYDLVLNGNEIGGGSIRIHSPVLQQKVFDILNIKKDSMQHIIDMLASGCPPHGGIALGLDRLMAMIVNANSIRDVIAFPKNFEGRDPLSGAPSEISEKEKKMYHIEVVE